ncbi:DUF2752 domain-containing protein [Synechococcales cyanobacterium C]|uniref:DUF2752 domain-containing protein n=1 Tax=Petrachloros mirabilis ULC683 TaxID=2781853 RepID=A0A8K2A1W0_9CYAN|nr:DUF2752 domain-containing protein [Petrachloros mirabilis ULC683]
MVGSNSLRFLCWDIHLQPIRRTEAIFRLGILGFSLSPFFRIIASRNHLSWSFWRCIIRDFTGVPCPSCGMTRAFLAIAQGNWQAALDFHLLSPIVLVFFALLVIHLGFELFLRQKISTPLSRLFWSSRTLLVGFSIVLFYHSLRLCNLWSTGELQQQIAQAPLGQLFH